MNLWSLHSRLSSTPRTPDRSDCCGCITLVSRLLHAVSGTLRRGFPEIKYIPASPLKHARVLRRIYSQANSDHHASCISNNAMVQDDLPT
jgi:hypothetical protein